MSSGFAEHGHLAGVPALLVVLGDPVEEGRRPVSFNQFMTLARLNTGRLVYLYISGNDPVVAKEAAEIHYRLSEIGVQVSACVSPGVYLPCDRLAYESVLRITDADIHDLEFLDTRLGSVSVHSWPGSRVMSALTALPAEHGRFLILRGDDLGQAKVWLNGEHSSRWRIIPSHPLNEFEAAELCEMAR